MYCANFKRAKNNLLSENFSKINFNKAMPLFGKSQKSPSEIVKQLKEAVNSLEKGDKKAEKAQEDISKNLVSLILCELKNFILLQQSRIPYIC